MKLSDLPVRIVVRFKPDNEPFITSTRRWQLSNPKKVRTQQIRYRNKNRNAINARQNARNRAKGKAARVKGVRWQRVVFVFAFAPLLSNDSSYGPPTQRRLNNTV